MLYKTCSVHKFSDLPDIESFAPHMLVGVGDFISCQIDGFPKLSMYTMLGDWGGWTKRYVWILILPKCEQLPKLWFPWPWLLLYNAKWCICYFNNIIGLTLGYYNEQSCLSIWNIKKERRNKKNTSSRRIIVDVLCHRMGYEYDACSIWKRMRETHTHTHPKSMCM